MMSISKYSNLKYKKMILTENKHRVRETKDESASLCVVVYFAHIDLSNYSGEKKSIKLKN